jgi:hypothetical protein
VDKLAHAVGEDKKSIGLVNVDAGDVTKELVKPVYEDLAKPAVSQIGQALGTVAETINRFGLGPLRLANHWGKEREEELKASISQKVAARKIETPQEVPPSIGVAALEGYVLNAERAELSEMFLNLLVTAMDPSADLPHPSFPDIVKQLTPDEARILNRVPFGPPLGGVEWAILRHSEGGGTEIAETSTDALQTIAARAGADFRRMPVSLGNLTRLGLLTERTFGQVHIDSQDDLQNVADDEFRRAIVRQTEADPILSGAIRSFPIGSPRHSDRRISVTLSGRFFHETQLSIAFYKACIFDPSTAG